VAISDPFLPGLRFSIMVIFSPDMIMGIPDWV
jgi:hypothetical protein